MSERPGPPPVRPPRPAAPPALPHEPADLSAALVRPARAMQLVLAEPDRLSRTISTGRGGLLLATLLLLCSALFALPYGAVLDPERSWRIVLLYVGSLGICFPSLVVFSTYVGCKVDVRESLSLGLVVTAVAALFTFGFAPILWFLRATMLEESATITPAQLSVGLLALSLLAGVVHLFRCLRTFEGLMTSYRLLIFAWQMLFVFITWRMARVLELLA